MKYKEIELYLELFSDYLKNRNVYNYQITNMVINYNCVIFNYMEIGPNGSNSSPSILIFSIGLNELTIRNKYGKDCIYDYLSENDLSRREADEEMLKYKQKIIAFKERYCL